MTRTYEELLAAQTELAHFNPFHNPKNGQFAKKNGGVSSLSPRGKQIAKRAGTAAGVMAGVSALATVGNAINAQKGLDTMGFGDKLSIPGAIAKGTIQAGKVAAVTALAVIGGHMVKDYMTDTKSKRAQSTIDRMDKQIEYQKEQQRKDQARKHRLYSDKQFDQTIEYYEKVKKKQEDKLNKLR